MLGRGVGIGNSFFGIGGALGSTRQFAAMNVVKARMKSVNSIRKITKAMKMVAGSKLRHDERRMQIGLPFAKPSTDLMKRLPSDKIPLAPQVTFVGLTSDRGLCGGVNSGVARSVRNRIIDLESQGKEVKYIGVGAKGTNALKRLFADRFICSCEDVQKNVWNFVQASAVAERLLASDPQSVFLVYNHYKSAISYETACTRLVTKAEVKSVDKAEWSRAIDQYSFEPSVFELWDDLHEFYYASAIFGAMLDGIASEQSARMAAMGNASKNAGEMLDKLTLQYNKARQTKITTELCEIISGATAL
jgi:F-type H+-transporting ATPase subunit gamma